MDEFLYLMAFVAGAIAIGLAFRFRQSRRQLIDTIEERSNNDSGNVDEE